jgi:hypothetical protein
MGNPTVIGYLLDPFFVPISELLSDDPETQVIIQMLLSLSLPFLVIATLIVYEIKNTKSKNG